jgi:hypothetical protein
VATASQSLVSQDELLFLSIIKEILPQHRRLSDSVLTKRIGKERLKDSCDELLGFITSGVSDQLDKNEQIALMSKCLRCLVDFMKEELHQSVTLKTLIDHFSLLSEAVDRAFPSYREAGLLRQAIGWKR